MGENKQTTDRANSSAMNTGKKRCSKCDTYIKPGQDYTDVLNGLGYQTGFYEHRSSNDCIENLKGAFVRLCAELAEPASMEDWGDKFEALAKREV